MTTEPESGPPAPSAGPPPAEPTAVAPTPTASVPATESTAGLLQEMLSRAVQGQVGDQRELSGAIGDMRAQVIRLGQEIGELRARPPHDDTVDAQINTVTVEMREAVRFLSERLDGVTRMVAQRGEELADIRMALSTIDAHVRSQAETIGVLSAGMQTLPSYGERVSGLQDNLQGLHRQLIGIESALAESNNDDVLARLTTMEGTLEASHSNAGASSDEVRERLVALESALSESATATPDEELLATLSAIQAAVAASSSGNDAVLERLAAIEGSIDDAVAAAVAPMAATVAELADAHSSHAAAVASLHDRLEPLALDVTAIGGNVAGLVEGSEGSTALDARVSELVRAAETRLAAHIDEAVLALADTLLRRRQVSSSAAQITGTPMMAPPDVEPLRSPAFGQPAVIPSYGTTDDRSSAAAGLDPAGSPLDEGAADAAPGHGQWASGEGTGDVESGGAAPIGDLASYLDGEDDTADHHGSWPGEDSADGADARESAAFEPTDDSGLAADDDVDDETDDSYDVDLYDEEDDDQPDGGVPDEAEVFDEVDVFDEAGDDAEEYGVNEHDVNGYEDTASEDLGSEDANEEPTGPPEQADDGGLDETGPIPRIAAAPSGSERAADVPAAWRPQTPPARDPADPTVTLEPQKRRWGRRGR